MKTAVMQRPIPRPTAFNGLGKQPDLSQSRHETNSQPRTTALPTELRSRGVPSPAVAQGRHPNRAPSPRRFARNSIGSGQVFKSSTLHPQSSQTTKGRNPTHESKTHRTKVIESQKGGLPTSRPFGGRAASPPRLNSPSRGRSRTPRGPLQPNAPTQSSQSNPRTRETRSGLGSSKLYPILKKPVGQLNIPTETTGRGPGSYTVTKATAKKEQKHVEFVRRPVEEGAKPTGLTSLQSHGFGTGNDDDELSRIMRVASKAKGLQVPKLRYSYHADGRVKQSIGVETTSIVDSAHQGQMTTRNPVIPGQSRQASTSKCSLDSVNQVGSDKHVTLVDNKPPRQDLSLKSSSVQRPPVKLADGGNFGGSRPVNGPTTPRQKLSLSSSVEKIRGSSVYQGHPNRRIPRPSADYRQDSNLSLAENAGNLHRTFSKMDAEFREEEKEERMGEGSLEHRLRLKTEKERLGQFEIAKKQKGKRVSFAQPTAASASKVTATAKPLSDLRELRSPLKGALKNMKVVEPSKLSPPEMRGQKSLLPQHGVAASSLTLAVPGNHPTVSQPSKTYMRRNIISTTGKTSTKVESKLFTNKRVRQLEVTTSTTTTSLASTNKQPKMIFSSIKKFFERKAVPVPAVFAPPPSPPLPLSPPVPPSPPDESLLRLGDEGYTAEYLQQCPVPLSVYLTYIHDIQKCIDRNKDAANTPVLLTGYHSIFSPLQVHTTCRGDLLNSYSELKIARAAAEKANRKLAEAEAQKRAELERCWETLAALYDAGRDVVGGPAGNTVAAMLYGDRNGESVVAATLAAAHLPIPQQQESSVREDLPCSESGRVPQRSTQDNSNQRVRLDKEQSVRPGGSRALEGQLRQVATPGRAPREPSHRARLNQSSRSAVGRGQSRGRYPPVVVAPRITPTGIRRPPPPIPAPLYKISEKEEDEEARASRMANLGQYREDPRDADGEYGLVVEEGITLGGEEEHLANSHEYRQGTEDNHLYYEDAEFRASVDSAVHDLVYYSEDL